MTEDTRSAARPRPEQPEPERAAQDLPPRAKPMLAAEELVAHLKSRGVTFELCSEADAAAYLAHANNYLRAASYRKLYPVHAEGPNSGRYIGLDFGALVELSSVDRVLRTALRDIALDVEHFAKVRLLDRALSEGEDGYAVVSDYLEGHLTSRSRSRVSTGLASRGRAGEGHDEYSGDLIAHYNEQGYPLWVFLEVIEFWRFCDLWLFCAGRWDDEAMVVAHYWLKSIRALRNSACHNSCIVNGFSSSSDRAVFQTPDDMLRSMNALGLKNTKSRRAKMRNLRVAHIAATLYGSYELCTRESTRARHAEAMGSVRRAFDAARPVCPADGSLTGYFDFIMKLVDIWCPKRA